MPPRGEQRLQPNPYEPPEDARRRSGSAVTGAVRERRCREEPVPSGRAGVWPGRWSQVTLFWGCPRSCLAGQDGTRCSRNRAELGARVHPKPEAVAARRADREGGGAGPLPGGAGPVPGGQSRSLVGQGRSPAGQSRSLAGQGRSPVGQGGFRAGPVSMTPAYPLPSALHRPPPRLRVVIDSSHSQS